MSADISDNIRREIKSFNLESPPPIARSRRAKIIARGFGLTLPEKVEPAARPSLDPMLAMQIASLAPSPGQIVLIAGPSGAGKSSLLRAIRSLTRNTVRWIDLHRINPPPSAVVDAFGRHVPLNRTLAMLSRVGLAEVWTYLRKPHELSEGQRWRLRLAIALMRSRRRARTRAVIVCDEFAALLDRVTAAIVARTLRRSIDSHRESSAIVATTHEDLIKALDPDVIVRCDFARIEIERRSV